MDKVIRVSAGLYLKKDYYGKQKEKTIITLEAYGNENGYTQYVLCPEHFKKCLEAIKEL